jgi:dTDP-4-dehydrorhamnose 3,5-epimerase
MQFVEMEIPGLIVVEPDVHRDHRGFFLETYHVEKYRSGGINGPFVQDNHSLSTAGTLRGLHLQARRPQGKLVRAIRGEIFDVAVDVRRGSPTFGRWVGVTLTSDNFKQVYLPAGCAHGFYVLSPSAEVEYKCTSVRDAADEIGIAWNDPRIGIRWPTTDPLLSDRDRGHAGLDGMADRLPEWTGRP